MSTSKKFSKRMALLLAVVMCVVTLSSFTTAFALTTPSVAQTSPCRLLLNNEQHVYNPYYKNSTLMVPLGSIVESAGWAYSYKNGTAAFGAKGKAFSVTIGKNAYVFNKKTYTLDFAPELTDNNVYVPWQYLERALGMDVNIGSDGVILVAATIYTPTPATTPVPTNTPVPTTTPKPSSPPSPAPTSPAQGSGSRLYLNNRLQGANPYYKGATLMLPLRTATENAGWLYNYSNKTSAFGANGKAFTVTLGKNAYTFNGKTYKLAYAPELVDRRIYVPWQYLELALGMDVAISATGRVDVSAPKVSPTMYSLTINGKKSPALPYMSGKTLMLPLREISEKLGYTYIYSNKLRNSVFFANGIGLEIKWDKNLYPINNQLVALERAPFIKFGAVCVPSSFIERAMKAVVTKNGYVISITR